MEQTITITATIPAQHAVEALKAAGALPAPPEPPATPATPIELQAADPVGIQEIAARLGVQTQTVHAWRYRHLLPEPRWWISATPAWDWTADIEPWARTTGRLERFLDGIDDSPAARQWDTAEQLAEPYPGTR